MRIKTIFLVVVICLLLISCSSNSNLGGQNRTEAAIEQSISQQDTQNQYLFTTATSFQDTDGVYLGNNLGGNYLHYYDKASGISGVLCADPACSHDTSTCGAYMEAGANLSVHDGKLYWVAGDALWCSDLSGMNREKVKRLSFEDVTMQYQPQRYVVHQGMLYILGEASTVDGTQSSMRLTLLSTALDASEELTVLQDESFDCGVERSVRFVGKYAYISLVTFVPGSRIYDVSIQRIDLTTGTIDTIYTESGMAATPGALWATEQGDLYMPGADDNCAYVWKIEGAKRVEIMSWTGTKPSVPKVIDGAAVYLSRNDGIREVEIINLSGEEIYNGMLYPQSIPGLDVDPNECSFAFVGGDRDKLIFNLHIHIDLDYPQDYTILLDINDNMRATVLWSSKD